MDLTRAAACAAGCLAVAGCGKGGTAAAPDRAAGRRLFVAQRCGSCHALRAVGARGRIGPDLDTSERLSLAQVRASLVEGANGMPSYAGRLSPRQLDDLAAFLHGARR
jgi:mono/diheme cytochrome c family protein